MAERVTSISFERYRAFEGAQTLELRPLTIVFGRNSAGKSAAVRALPILASAAKRRELQPSRASVLDYSTPALKGAVFEDVLYGRTTRGALKFKISKRNSEFDFDVRDLGGVDGERVTDFRFITPAKRLFGQLSGESGLSKYVVQDELDSDYLDEWELNGVRPVADPVLGQRSDQDRLQCFLDEFSVSVHWLGAVRSQMPRFFQLRNGVPYRVAHDGSGTAEVLRLSQTADDGISTSVSAWLKAACGFELTYAETDEQIALGRQNYSFEVRPSRNWPSSMSVRDVGEGISQALPVVTLCHQARLGFLGDNPILVFEQPELHLHPRATVALADEIISCAVDGPQTCHLIETHSESFLLGIQIALVEKRIEPSRVVVYWVEMEAQESSLRKIEFDEEGYPISGWPEGVFKETLSQAQYLSRLRLRAYAPST